MPKPTPPGGYCFRKIGLLTRLTSRNLIQSSPGFFNTVFLFRPSVQGCRKGSGLDPYRLHLQQLRARCRMLRFDFSALEA